MAPRKKGARGAALAQEASAEQPTAQTAQLAWPRLHLCMLVATAACIFFLERWHAPGAFWWYRGCMCAFLLQGGFLALRNHPLWWTWLACCLYLNAHKFGLWAPPQAGDSNWRPRNLEPIGEPMEWNQLRVPQAGSSAAGSSAAGGSPAEGSSAGSSAARTDRPPAVPPATWKIPDEALFYGERGMAPFFMEHLAQWEAGDKLNLAGMGLHVMAPDTFRTRTDAGARARERLMSLSLNDNLLTMLPKNVFMGLSKLRVLYLDGNQITSLQQPFKKLHSLEDLHLGRNRLRDIPPKTFAGLSKLKSLAMGANTLGTLPGGVFKDLASLAILWLDDCRLESLPANVFAGLHGLEKLVISSNYLRSLPVGIFRGLAQLRFLNLQHNPMDSLPVDVYVDLVAELAKRPLGISPCFRNEWEGAWQCYDAHKKQEIPPHLAKGLAPEAMRADFHYKGPCWDDTDVVSYDEELGKYFLTWPLPSGKEAGKKGVDAGQGAGKEVGGEAGKEDVDKGLTQQHGPAPQKYDVHYLVQGDFFCGIQAFDFFSSLSLSLSLFDVHYIAG